MFISKKYNIIYADPPWKFIGWNVNKSGKHSPSQHYECQDLDWIKKLPVNKLADKDCILFMWVTYPTMEVCFEVLKAWGFKYSTVGFTWVKLNKLSSGYFFGLGYWTRANPEICIIATKGHPKRINKSISNLIVSKLRKHSQKPDEVRENIVKLCGDLPRIELFARQRFEGWDVWGNEAPKDVQKYIK